MSTHIARGADYGELVTHVSLSKHSRGDLVVILQNEFTNSPWRVYVNSQLLHVKWSSISAL